MKSLIICISIHKGNTRKIADAMAEVLEAEIVKLTEVGPEDLKEYDLIGFGSGIYYGKHHETLFQLVNKLPSFGDKEAFVFSTSGLPKLPLVHEFYKSSKNKLKEKGFKVIGEFNCRGWETYLFFLKPFGGINKGRPNEKDLEKAREFAKELKASS